MNKFCPNCSSSKIQKLDDTVCKCEECSFQIFSNPTPSCTVVIFCGENILLGKRNRNPDIGRWHLIGGFLDSREKAEDCMIREVKEEVGIDIKFEQSKIIGTFVHDYEYQNENIGVTTVAFVVQVDESQRLQAVAGDDVGEIKWVLWSEAQKLDLPFANNEILQKALESMGFVPEDDLELIRKEIDQTDNQILELLARRFNLVAQIAKHKIKNNLPILNAKRWHSLLKSRIQKAYTLGIDGKFVEEIWHKIHQYSRQKEEEIITSSKSK
jgi:chorismate mutase/8-oxo-dGTP pyrophosphatase MutT (NUDIX family)